MLRIVKWDVSVQHLDINVNFMRIISAYIIKYDVRVVV